MTDCALHHRVVILGGGPAGCAAAVLLARAGYPVTLLERELAPKHKVCGEFLSVEALELLRQLGINPVEHAAPRVSTVRLVSSSHVTEACLPFAARSLTRRCLDGLLLEAAELSGACLQRGRIVESLTRDSDYWIIGLSDGGTLRSDKVVFANGKHDLRGFPRPPGVQGDLVAFKMYFGLSDPQRAALDGAVELLLHPFGYTGLQLAEDGSANLCALVRRDHLNHLGGWQQLLAELKGSSPHAAQRLEGAAPLLSKPLAISSIPYGFVRREAIAPGLYAVGDQAAVIPSFTGDGMSMALYTGARAAHAILGGETSATFQRSVHRELHRQVSRATALSRGLVHPVLQPLLTGAARLWPASLRSVASVTRLPRSSYT